MTMTSTIALYYAFIARLRTLSSFDNNSYGGHDEPNNGNVHGVLSRDRLRLGSAPNGDTIIHLNCANLAGIGRPCPNMGSLPCDACGLVKYCSDHCQQIHWTKHRRDCQHPYLNLDWEPRWVCEKRDPDLRDKESAASESYPLPKALLPKRVLWGNIPAVDCLRLSGNEGLEDERRAFKLCFAASGDIRNLVRTVNALPPSFNGECEILLNDVDSVVVSRNAVILNALLNPDSSIEEAAEFAVHLMYSSVLPPESAAQLGSCIRDIYGSEIWTGKSLSFQRSLPTRGRGFIHLTQTLTGMKTPMDMFNSDYSSATALKGMRDVLFDPARVDDREYYLAGLKPAHRLATLRFWELGVLAPFSVDVRHFTQPNRLLFSANGDWLITHRSSSPLHSWDISTVISSGERRGVEPNDIFGCLFFHVKEEFKEFARRIRDLPQLNIHLSQFDARVLAKGIQVGVLPPFGVKCFDRVDASNISDSIGVAQVLDDWAPLLKKENDKAALLMHSAAWHLTQPKATVQSNPRAMPSLLRRSTNSSSVALKLQAVLAQGTQSPRVLRLVDSLDVFHDNEKPFMKYLRGQGTRRHAMMQGLKIRTANRVYVKRFGVPVDASPDQKLPDVTREEFYNIFTIGGADFSVRFMEFERARTMVINEGEEPDEGSVSHNDHTRLGV